VAGADGQALVHRQPVIGAQRCKNDHAIRPLGPGYPESGGQGFGEIFILSNVFTLEFKDSGELYNAQKDINPSNIPFTYLILWLL
jgi:hypothetical protein